MADDKPTKHNWRFKDLTGQRFGNLVAIENVPAQYVSATCRGATMWRCQCDCPNANTVVVSYSNLKSGKQISCGCQKGVTRRTHFMCQTPEYFAWMHAKMRCFNPKNKDFPRYGGRGIAMSKEWAESFETFFADMGPRPDGTTIDRIDNSGPYTGPCAQYPNGNCRWATILEQNNNRRPRRWKVKPKDQPV